jgi:hypothetical protein
MELFPHKPLRAAGAFGLTFFLGTAEARPLFLADQFPGPWLEVTQDIRDLLTQRKVSACSQAAARESTRNPGEYLLYCTSDEKTWTSWRVKPTTRTVRGPGGLSPDIPIPGSY